MKNKKSLIFNHNNFNCTNTFMITFNDIPIEIIYKFIMKSNSNIYTNLAQTCKTYYLLATSNKKYYNECRLINNIELLAIKLIKKYYIGFGISSKKIINFISNKLTYLLKEYFQIEYKMSNFNDYYLFQKQDILKKIHLILNGCNPDILKSKQLIINKTSSLNYINTKYDFTIDLDSCIYMHIENYYQYFKKN